METIYLEGCTPPEHLRDGSQLEEVIVPKKTLSCSSANHVPSVPSHKFSLPNLQVRQQEAGLLEVLKFFPDILDLPASLFYQRPIDLDCANIPAKSRTYDSSFSEVGMTVS